MHVLIVFGNGGGLLFMSFYEGLNEGGPFDGSRLKITRFDG